MSQAPTPDSSSKGLPPWLSFLLLVIGPPAVFVTLIRTVTQNPVLIALLVGGYEVLLFVLRFTAKIWQPLEEQLAKHISQWLTVRTQELTSRYYRRYCQYLVYEHQVFDVKGLSTRTAHDLELEQVFVDLFIHPTPPHRASADPLHLPASLQGTHSVWDYLSNIDLANHHLIVLGAPGSGKTTLLKHLALTLAQPKKYPRRRGEHHTFPILLLLRDHARSIVDQSDFSLVQAVQDHIQQKWQQTMPTTWINRRLERGHCLVLLDGLDEVADSSTRKLVAAWVQRQLNAYGRNRFVLTSRPYGYQDNPLDGVTVLDVQSFTLDKIEQFVQNWYLANELKSWGKDDPGVHLRTREGTRDLLQRLHQAPALLELAVNPLLLTMIATVHRYRSSLPGKRVDLYAEICEVFLGKRYEARGIKQDLSPAQKQHVLQSLAYFLMQQGTREILNQEVQRVIAPALASVSRQMEPADFLRLIQDTSGLLLERNPGIYGFAHLTFQEYLAAVHIKEKGMEQILITQVANSWWHETIRLYCAQTDATALILACLAGNKSGNPPTATTLALAFECDEEKLRIQPQAQDQLNVVLKVGGTAPTPEMQHIFHVIAEALLTRRLRRMVHLHQETYIDTTLITCAEYQLFLDEQETQGRYYPDHWTHGSFPAGLGQTPVLGVRQSDAQAFCTWLTAREGEVWHYRLPRAKEWPLEERKKQRELIAETGYWVTDESCFSWSQGQSPDFLQRQLSHCISRALDIARTLFRTGPFDLASTLDRDRALSIARDLVLDHALANSFDLDNVFAHYSASNLTDDRELDSALTDALDFANSRELAGKSILTSACDRALAFALGYPKDIAFDLYITLFLLQERIAGNLPAYEGILLVKEPRQKSRGSEV